MKINEELLDVDNIKASRKQLIDLFIRRTAVLTSTDEALTEKIIKDQWGNANKQMQSASSVAEVYFPSIGKFSLSTSKAQKRLKSLAKATETILNSETEEAKKKEYISRNDNHINNIKRKLKQE